MREQGHKVPETVPTVPHLDVGAVDRQDLIVVHQPGPLGDRAGVLHLHALNAPTPTTAPRDPHSANQLPLHGR